MSMATDATIAPTEGLEEELSALVEAGHYGSEREVIRHALDALLEANPTLRLEMAMTLWKQKKITLSRAVALAQSDHETFKEEIAKRGLYVEIDMSPEEVKRQAQAIPHPRPST
jgi:predicted HTH domain antitoxin